MIGLSCARGHLRHPKLYREGTGLGLKEAKDAVDDMG